MSDMQGGNFLAPQMSTAITQDRQMSNMSHKIENAVKAGHDGTSAYLGESPHQQSQMVGGGGSPIQNAYIASKQKEDIFLKNNLEYE